MYYQNLNFILPYIQINFKPKLTILDSFLRNSSRAFSRDPDSSNKEIWEKIQKNCCMQHQILGKV